MKEKYTLTVANSQINIVTEMPKEEIDAIVGIVDRRIREIHLHSKGCSRTDAAVLLCLDYCAEKIELQKTVKSFNAQIEKLTALNEVSSREINALEREIEVLRASLSSTPTVKAATLKKLADGQLAFDQMGEEVKAPVESKVEEKPISNAVEKILSENVEDHEKNEDIATESLTPPEDKPHAKARKKKVRAMFDMISFDDI